MKKKIFLIISILFFTFNIINVRAENVETDVNDDVIDEIKISETVSDEGTVQLNSSPNLLLSKNDGWFIDDDGAVYYYVNGNKVTGLQEINDRKYFFDQQGKRSSGFQMADENIYFFSRISDNSMKYGWQYIDGYYYYFDETGKMLTGVQEIGGVKYYFNNQGKRSSGFQTADENTYFFSRISDNSMKYGWQYIDGYYYYFDETGKMLINDQQLNDFNVNFGSNGKLTKGIVNIKGKNYFYDNNIKQTSFQTVDGNTYFFSRINDNAMKYGWQYIDGYYYYFDVVGKMIKGLQEISGVKYYFDNQGKRSSGFQTADENTYFFSRISDNSMKYGWQYIDGYYYYFDEQGKMLTNEQALNNFSVKFGADGKLIKGIVNIKGRYYCYDNNVKLTAFQTIDGNTYFFSRINDNAMKYGWQYIDGYYYYFKENGIMAYGFNKIGNVTYFFNRLNGRMRTGFVNIDGPVYYFDSNGAMAIGKKRINGTEYNFDENGVLLSGWKEIDGKTYFMKSDGNFATDWYYVDGQRCFFNSLGVLIAKNAKKIIDVYSGQGNIDWDALKASGEIDGVIVKIGDGSTMTDSKLKRNIDALNRLGIPYGIYLFSYSENAQEGAAEASFTKKLITDYHINPTLGIYLDIESWAYISNPNINSDHITPEMYDAAITSYIQNMSGYKNVGIYTGKNYAMNRLNAHSRSYITWMAQYDHYCTYTGTYKMWQYSSNEYVTGISTRVDMSVMFN